MSPEKKLQQDMTQGLNELMQERHQLAEEISQ